MIAPSNTHIASAQIGDASLFATQQTLKAGKAIIAFAVFVGAIALAAFNVAPIAATAFAGAVLLILLRVITADQAYRGLKPEILMLIAGMVVIGLAMEKSGLAEVASRVLIGSVDGVSPIIALIVLYVVTIVLTELLSNATVAVR